MTQKRVAIVKGLRTPFVKAGGAYAQLTALDLGRIVVQELVQRSWAAHCCRPQFESKAKARLARADHWEQA